MWKKREEKIERSEMFKHLCSCKRLCQFIERMETENVTKTFKHSENEQEKEKARETELNEIDGK